MKPFVKLNKLGNSIFQELVHHLENHGIEDIDNLKLTTLAHQFQIYAEAAKKLEEGFTNKHDQISPAVSTLDKALNAIIKLSTGFGIDPASREKIQSFAVKEEKLPTFE